MEFIQNIDFMKLINCFIIGGIICVIGQILIDKTKLTSARILVIFVTTGAILGGLGIYEYLIDLAGAGATVPLTGFGNALAQGAIEGAKQFGLLRCIYRRNFCNSWWHFCSYIFWIFSIINS